MFANLLHIKPLTKLSDEELVRQFGKTGKQMYFAELYKRYAPLGFGVCLKYLKSEAEGEDVLSEVFRILYRKIPSTDIKSFRKYFYTVTRNECIARLRKKRTESARLSEWQKTETNPHDFMENEGFLRLMDGEPSVEKIISEAVQSLGADQEKCIRLFFYENKSYKEIVTMTGYTEKQVKSFLQNGKRNLKIKLQEFMRKKSL